MNPMQPPNMHAPQEMYIPGKRPMISPGLSATSPMVCIASQTQASPKPIFTPLPLQSAEVTAECHIATAFVKIEFVVDATNTQGGPGVLILPKNYDTTVTEAKIQNLTQHSVYATMVVPKDEAGRYAARSGNRVNPGAAGEDPVDPNNPELFIISFGNIKPRDLFRVTVHFFQPLLFQQGYYQLQFPLEWPQQMLSGGSAHLSALMHINCSINTGVPTEVNWKCPTHKMVPKTVQPGRLVLAADREVKWENSDFMIGYEVWGRAIVASMNIQAPNPVNKAQDPRGNFALSVSPPAPDVTQPFVKSVILIVDRSGSMQGKPIEYAKKALMAGLDMLSPMDLFTIIAYDHEQITWSGTLKEATQENVSSANHWISGNVVARGLTDIKTPLQQAIQMLQGSPFVPYIFLLTDGAVEDERDIAQYLQNEVNIPGAADLSVPRVSTFAIGPYCNHFFLKQLAVIGRGMFDVAFTPFSIQAQMERMLDAAAKPVLTDVRIRMDGPTDVELYPFPIPDLFVGHPLLVSGKYNGNFPPTVQILGKLPNGDEWSQDVHTTQAAAIPLDKVFVKQRLDVLTAAAWLNDDGKMVQQVIEESVNSGIVTPHTSMLLMQTTEENLEDIKKKKAQGKNVVLTKYAVGGAAGIALLAGAGLAFGFGDIASSVGNVPIPDFGDFGGIGDVFPDIADGIGGLCGGCGDCCGDIGTCLGDCFEGMGECMSELLDCCGTCLECLGNCDF
ncbi:unnamed protein product [Ostreobium quekettii]|uniref:VWFA domain-containing protein n=1 Tax=Ostreobium quekettii TaxID=121088 RepID=A0A8S1JCL9_9CHLO|nr:unnamed protein product [Ostreobium quekettii]CAD7704904.1 unnamed protein product [Ostreobium quekettii]|eukprot:evm.model.scf_159.1 EVM.evm.TU.scf_159.1   scf_159:7213-15896(-)